MIIIDKLSIVTETQISKYIYKCGDLIRTPAAQVHDGPQRLLRLIFSPLFPQSINRIGRSSRGHPSVGLRDGVDVVLHALMDRSQHVVPPAKPRLIFERFDHSHARSRNPRTTSAHRTGHDLSAWFLLSSVVNCVCVFADEKMR